MTSHNLSCTASHSYLGTQLQVKACHHTPEKLWNQIHVHKACQRVLNFAAQLVQQNWKSGQPTKQGEGSKASPGCLALATYSSSAHGAKKYETHRRLPAFCNF